jgi:hypothetical protein
MSIIQSNFGKDIQPKHQKYDYVSIYKEYDVKKYYYGRTRRYILLNFCIVFTAFMMYSFIIFEKELGKVKFI